MDEKNPTPNPVDLGLELAAVSELIRQVIGGDKGVDPNSLVRLIELKMNLISMQSQLLQSRPQENSSVVEEEKSN